MELNKRRRQDLEKQGPWQQVEHVKLQYHPVRSSLKEFLVALESQHREPRLLRPRYPVDGERKRKKQNPVFNNKYPKSHPRLPQHTRHSSSVGSVHGNKPEKLSVSASDYLKTCNPPLAKPSAYIAKQAQHSLNKQPKLVLARSSAVSSLLDTRTQVPGARRKRVSGGHSNGSGTDRGGAMGTLPIF